jgi:hypothetical protein
MQLKIRLSYSMAKLMLVIDDVIAICFARHAVNMFAVLYECGTQGSGQSTSLPVTSSICASPSSATVDRLVVNCSQCDDDSATLHSSRDDSHSRCHQYHQQRNHQHGHVIDTTHCARRSTPNSRFTPNHRPPSSKNCRCFRFRPRYFPFRRRLVPDRPSTPRRRPALRLVTLPPVARIRVPSVASSSPRPADSSSISISTRP